MIMSYKKLVEGFLIASIFGALIFTPMYNERHNLVRKRSLDDATIVREYSDERGIEVQHGGVPAASFAQDFDKDGKADSAYMILLSRVPIKVSYSEGMLRNLQPQYKAVFDAFRRD